MSRPSTATRAAWGFASALILASVAASAQIIPFAFMNAAGRQLVFTTSSHTLLVGACSGAVTVQSRIAGTPTNVASPVTVNLSGPTSTAFYSDSYCSEPIAAATIVGGTNSVTVYFTTTVTGSVALTATATDHTMANQSHTSNANGFRWTGGGGDANWTTGANWSGGSAPGSGNVAIFDGTCASNCSPLINSAINVGGIRMNVGYAGTITVGNFSPTIGTSGFAQAAGTFVANNNSIYNMTINGPFAVGGGNFTAPRGNLNLNHHVLFRGAPSVNMNSGTTVVTCQWGTYNNFLSGTVSFNTMTLQGEACTIDFNASFVIVNGNLNLSAWGWNASFLNGSLLAYGNVNATNNGCKGDSTAVVRLMGNPSGQTLGSSGSAGFPSVEIAAGSNTVTFGTSVRLRRNFTYTSGNLVTTGSTLFLNPDIINWGATYSPGNVTYENVTLLGNSNGFTIAGSNLKVGGTLTLNDDQYTATLTGTIEAYGNVAMTSNGGWDGTHTVRVMGNASGQTVSATTGTFIQGLDIAAGTNPVTLSGPIELRNAYTVTSVGTLTTTGSTLHLNRWSGTMPVHPGSAVYNNVIFTNDSANFDLNGGTLQVGGNLTINGGFWACAINNGTIEARGNVTTANFACGGTAQFRFAGTGAQTFTQVAGGRWFSGGTAVANTGGGYVILGQAASLASSAWTFSAAGLLYMNGFNFTVQSLNLGGLTINRRNPGGTGTGGTLTVGGTAYGVGLHAALNGSVVD